MNFKEAPILAGTAGGTLASTLPNIGTEHLITTCILALVGATVSFVMTLILKKLLAILKQFRLFLFTKSKRKN
ncbi:hypothetical protein [Aequorivita lipolytica]|uniref:DUF4126 domain-containing protein n=1 Tax=Aequorivita lipolytica TaxID=153267 RepID=A0A5C6YNI5_9FLAO|nr:hypothetical protein [Aequorivita lipolytica]TXD68971.1 hypothetical protein ESV24_09470 [Aequorivita lipolytica]SRX53034.1 hypothetical protein AEQU2_02280 [Aequorivita lipolytica]